jgi:hypothetical protein
MGILAHALSTVYGHQLLRDRLAAAWHGDRLPASLLFVGRRGVGKQRLALWLGQMLLCERAQVEALPEPCGACQHCRYAERGNHPICAGSFHARASKTETPPRTTYARIWQTLSRNA